MKTLTIEERLRLFLLVMAGLIFAGTPVELLFEEHTGTPAQSIPFILCGLGLIAVLVALGAPNRRNLTALRATMVLTFLGSLFGIYEHIEHNLAFELEIRPNAAIGQVLGDALTGASPLLAPGILALGAILALAATYYHPTFGKQVESHAE